MTRKVAQFGLRGGPREGIFECPPEVTPAMLELLFPGYKIEWVREGPITPIEDPLSDFEWVARLDWSPDDAQEEGRQAQGDAPQEREERWSGEASDRRDGRGQEDP